MSRSLLFAVLVLAGTAAAEPPPRHLAEPKHLPNAARQLLHERMARHSKDMTELVWAVVLLDYGEAARIADTIAAEPRLARPLGHDATELNTLLPERFFVLQDQLKQRTLELAQAARARDADALATTYGRVAETCVACHRTYLER